MIMKIPKTVRVLSNREGRKLMPPKDGEEDLGDAMLHYSSLTVALVHLAFMMH